MLLFIPFHRTFCSFYHRPLSYHLCRLYKVQATHQLALSSQPAAIVSVLFGCRWEIVAGRMTTLQDVWCSKVTALGHPNRDGTHECLYKCRHLALAFTTEMSMTKKTSRPPKRQAHWDYKQLAPIISRPLCGRGQRGNESHSQVSFDDQTRCTRP